MKQSLHQPFEVVFMELDECPMKAHEHNFFELIYILSGTGRQRINNSTFDYHADHMFLVTPDDCHSLDIKTTTKLAFIRFNHIFVENSMLQADSVKRLEFILSNANHEPGCILKIQPDKALVRPVIEALVREYANRDLYNQELIQQLMNTLIVVVARNIARYMPHNISEQSDGRAVDILQYIQANIYSPQKITAESLSKHFGISASYLGRYFKKHANETMQDYIARYKLRLIENRLQHSDRRIGEIARELGFTDESHLNRTFKKYKGMSPSGYRKSLTTP